MPRLYSRVLLVLPFALVAGLAVCVTGCGGDGVQVSTVPKADVGKGAPNAGVGAGEYRILGALFPADAPEWYFKFTGSTAQITTYEAEFDKLTKTVKLQADPTAVPAFDVPAGWNRTGVRVVDRGGIQIKTDETLRFGSPAAPQEITITYIPGGGLGQNLERWAKQVGATDLAPDKVTQKFDANGVKGLRVDLRGPKNPTGGGGPFMGKQ